MIVFKPITGNHARAFVDARERVHAIPVIAGDRDAVDHRVIRIVVNVVADAEIKVRREFADRVVEVIAMIVVALLVFLATQHSEIDCGVAVLRRGRAESA